MKEHVCTGSLPSATVTSFPCHPLVPFFFFFCVLLLLLLVEKPPKKPELNTFASWLAFFWCLLFLEAKKRCLQSCSAA